MKFNKTCVNIIWKNILHEPNTCNYLLVQMSYFLSKKNFMYKIADFIHLQTSTGGGWSVPHFQRTVWHGWWFKASTGKQTQQLCCYGCFSCHHHQCVCCYIHYNWKKGVITVKFTPFMTYIFLIHSSKHWCSCFLQLLK